MTLPANGQLGMSDIRNELQVVSQSPFSLSGATMGAYKALNNCSPVKPNQTTPYQISEWYSYCQLCACNLFCVSSGSTSCNCGGCCPGCTPGSVPLNDGSNNCVLVEVSADTPPTSPATVTHWACNNTAQTNYSINGSLFYQSATTNGDGTRVFTATTANVWKNDLANQCDYGPLLRSMVWTQSGSGGIPTDQWVCHTACFTASTATTETYYVGISGDNGFRLNLDGTVIVNSLGGLWSDTNPDTFRWWHVYPVTITAGAHTLQVCGYNIGDIAAFGCEIYDNTLQSLTAATSLNALNRIYSTLNYTGQNMTAIFTSGTGSTTLVAASSYTCDNSSFTYNPCVGDCVRNTTCVPS